MVKLKKHKAKLLIFAGFWAILLFLNHNYLIFADQDDDIENVITLIETKENQTEQIKIQCQDLLQKITQIKTEINKLAVNNQTEIQKYLNDPIFINILDLIKKKEVGAQQQVIDYLEQIYIWVQKLNTDVNSILTSFEILTAKTLKFREVSKEYDNVLDKITNIFSYMKSISTLNDQIYEQDSKSSVSDESSNLDAKVQEALDQLGGINKLKDQKVHVDQLNTQFNILKDQSPLTPSGVSGSSDTFQNNNSNVTNSFLFFFFVIFILLFVVLILYFIFQNFANTK